MWQVLFIMSDSVKVQVNEEFYGDILLPQQMLAAIKHVTDSNFVFQQVIARVV